MADIRCPNCGKNNPDILDACQFCQAPLKPESMLRIGENPTKKNTGELESVLPEWLRGVRQQARDSAEAEAAEAANRPNAAPEPPDLLAGLASQAGTAEEEEIPDWLTRINPAGKPEPVPPPSSTPVAKPDFFTQFEQSPDRPAVQPPPEEVSSPADQMAAPEEKDELSDWLARASEQPSETVELDSDTANLGNAGWTGGFDSPPPFSSPPEPAEAEDLGWLRDLEEAAKQTGDLKPAGPDSAQAGEGDAAFAASQPSPSREDLSWLENLGGIEEPEQPAAAETVKPQEDLSWLDQLGRATEPSQPSGAVPDKPAEQDLDWLKGLGQSAPLPGPANEPLVDATAARPPSQEDLSWLNDLASATEPEPLSTPPFVEPESGPGASTVEPARPDQADAEAEPDWLKSAAEAPSMPPPGDVSMEWFEETSQPAQEQPPASEPQPVPFVDLSSTPSEPSTLSGQDVDSLFSMEMPDWLSQPESGQGKIAADLTPLPPAESAESLAPVDLPSWVQAMRPVEAVISETPSGAQDQPEETEGPLAGLSGVIPGAPIGSSRRPKTLSLTLQATDEQQASAALLEQILGSETSPRALLSSPLVVSQQFLRWILSALFLIVLGVVIFLRSQTLAVSSNLPAGASAVSNTIASLPSGARALVVIDYEPALAGEMEAVGGPVLGQMVRSKNPSLSFISTSANGPALVDRLLLAARIDMSASEGSGEQAGTQYLNLGYLPGGSAGVLGFLERPAEMIPASGVQSFSEYAALILITDHADSGRVWVEQLQSRRQFDPALGSQPLLVLASAQAGPLLQPYASSQQIAGLVSGLSQAAGYELGNNDPGIARSYWDAFGFGLMLAIASIIIGSLWSVFVGIRARRAEAEQA